MLFIYLQFDEHSLQEHYLSEKHQKGLVKCAQHIKESTNSNTSKADLDTEEGNASLLEAYERLSIVTSNIDTNQDKLAQLDNEILRYRNQTLNFSAQLDNIQTELSLEEAHINAISLNENVLKQNMAALQQQIEGTDYKIKSEPDGTMVWKITNVQEKTIDAQSERQTSIYSPPFYTSNSGYKLCVRLYLNGDGSSRGTHTSIFLVILRGPYDSLLKWPFSDRVSFCLIDQRTMMGQNGTVKPKHIIESFRPDINSISFQRPCSAMNIASGIPKFVSLNELNQPANENLYIINDTMYIKTFVDFIGLSRSILPFIFNINIAFPAHIQHKLISDEIERREKQNDN